jgi:hypothetical protein
MLRISSVLLSIADATNWRNINHDCDEGPRQPSVAYNPQLLHHVGSLKSALHAKNNDAECGFLAISSSSANAS